jgi:glutamyl-tRNA(Gln) amidotransferase subunit E
VQEAINRLGYKTIPENELIMYVDQTIADNIGLVRERGEGSFGTLMGIMMNRLRGKTDAGLVSKMLKEKLKETL